MNTELTCTLYVNTAVTARPLCKYNCWLGVVCGKLQLRLELLRNQFEKKNVAQRAHVNELIQLLMVYTERDTQGLRKLFNSCEANIRALRALWVNEKSYSTIVVPTIIEKLPEQFRLTITMGAKLSARWKICY